MSDPVKAMAAHAAQMVADVAKLRTTRLAFEAQLAWNRERLPHLLEMVQRVQGSTLRELAQDLGISEGYLSAIKTGRISDRASPELIEKLAALLGTVSK